MMRRAFFSLVLALGALVNSSSGQLPAPGAPDDALFREGLREWGLTSWLEQHLADTPPRDAVDECLRRREKLLHEARGSDTPVLRRDALIVEAGDELKNLLEHHPQHSARAYWSLELVRDALERRDPAIFDHLLLYELPGRDRQRAHELSGQALVALENCRDEIAKGWQRLETLDESTIEQLTAAGAFRDWERLDGQSSFLLCWARLYSALSGADADRAEILRDILEKVTQRYAWTQLPPGQDTQRCQALLMAALAARHTGQFTDADRYARDVIATTLKIQSVTDRARLKTATLIGILEQIRVFIAANKWDEAAKAVEQANEWVRRNRPDELSALLAMALIERQVLARRASPAATQPSDGILVPAQALAPLEKLAQRSPMHRDVLYSTIAGAVEQESAVSVNAAFPLQLVVGGAVSDGLSARSAGEPVSQQRLNDCLTAMQTGLSAPDLAETIRGELRYLQGQAHYLNGQLREAVDAMAGLVDETADHDRAPAAVEYAAAIAQEWLQKAGPQDISAARQALIKAGRLLCKRNTDSTPAKKLQYYIAVALEQEGQLDSAVGEYSAVPVDDVNRPKAMHARARCVKQMWQQAVAASQPASRDLAGQALQAARDSVEATSTLQDADACIAADSVLNLAHLLSSAAIGKAAAAVETLNGFEDRFARCDMLFGTVLRERILALRQLNQLARARQVVDDFLKVDSANAGPMMMQLLEAMHDEIDAAWDRGELTEVQSVSREAAELSQTLLDWSKQYPGRVSPGQENTIHIWRAWSLLNVGEIAKALIIFTAREDGIKPEAALEVEMRLGHAECLLASDQPGQALPLFTEIWKSAPEHTPHWWQAFAGSLQCHSRLGSDAHQIVQAIRQQRVLAPDLGGPRWNRALEALEQTHTQKPATAPQ